MRRYLMLLVGCAVGISCTIAASYVRHLSNYPRSGGYSTFSMAPDGSGLVANFGVIERRSWWTGDRSYEYFAGLGLSGETLDSRTNVLPSEPHPALRRGAKGSVEFHWTRTDVGWSVTVDAVDWQTELVEQRS